MDLNWRRALSGAVARDGEEDSLRVHNTKKNLLYIYFLCGQNHGGS